MRGTVGAAPAVREWSAEQSASIAGLVLVVGPEIIIGEVLMHSCDWRGRLEGDRAGGDHFVGARHHTGTHEPSRAALTRHCAGAEKPIEKPGHQGGSKLSRPILSMLLELGGEKRIEWMVRAPKARAAVISAALRVWGCRGRCLKWKRGSV